MNPENVGEQIRMRHSSLWRKPMLYDRPVPETLPCHGQLNQSAETGVNWRTRNNSISTHSNFKRITMSRKTHSKQLQSVLREEEKQSNLGREMLKGLRQEAERIDRSKGLLSGMEELKRMNLLFGKELQRVRLPGVIKYAHIHNDYHQRVTNPGYSRNYLGKFYTK